MMNKQRIIDKLISPKTLIYSGVFLGVMLIAYLTVHYGLLFGLLLSVIPLGIAIVLKSFHAPKTVFFIVFFLNYFLMGIFRYFPSVQAGILLDVMLMYVFVILMVKSINSRVEWRNGITLLSVLSLIWFVYCFFELFNPIASQIAWAKSIRGIAIYFFVISVLTPIVLTKFIDLKRFLILLSVLTIIGVGKVFIQKYIGFDVFEKRWLYVDGGSSTHIIHSGVRYFSFFTDAGNFGAAMGFATVLFALISVHFSKKIRYYFIFVAILAGFGLIFSGTRGALFVPFAGFGLGIMLSMSFKKMVVGASALLLFIIFLVYTPYGNGNVNIRRMRSAFNQEDASFMVRKNNQKKLWELMKDKPFGNGIGMGGTKAKEFAPNALISQVPTDSWLVLIWVETGIVGITIYMLTHLIVLCYGIFLLFFRLRDPVIKGCVSALISALFGMLVASYGNEIWGQLPNIFILTVCQVFVFMSPKLDKELLESKQ